MANSETENIETQRPSKLGGLALKAVIVLGLVGVLGYFIQGQITPDVDPDKTKEIVIKTSGNNDDPGSTDPAHPNESLNLPEGAITGNVTQQLIDEADHPFDLLLDIAADGLKEIDRKYSDYTATLVSRVRTEGELRDEKYLHVKIRHEQKNSDSTINEPFSVYTKFLKPKANVGQEAIWVKGENDGKLIAHATGLLNLKRLYFDPEGAIPMSGNRYPIYEIGFRNLLKKMIELGTKDKKHGECTVTLKRKVEINGRVCTVFEAVHPQKREHFDFHIARIYIDDELNIPIGYEGYLWPEKEGEDPPLLERYYYTEIKFNVGLTDADFDPGNEEYNYPSL